MAIIAKTVKLGTIAAADFYRRKLEADLCLAGRINRELLQQILLFNQGTEYGQYYRFDRITAPESYKKDVPLTVYEDYLPYIGRIAAGESNLLTVEPVNYFSLTSGTTGDQKMIPMTTRAGRALSGHMDLLPQGILFHAIPASRSFYRGLTIMNTITSGADNGKLSTRAGTSGGIQSHKRIMPHLWTSPPAIMEVPHQRSANYLHLLFALKERELMYISSPFSSAVADLFRLLEEEWPQLVQDLAAGRISMNGPLTPRLRQELERKLGCNPERARELAVEFTLGLDGVARRIWPHLLYVNCVAGGSFSIYAQQLRQYIGDLPIYSGLYGAAEALVGISLRPGETAYAVTPRTAYHEFIPLGQVGEDQPQALDLDQLNKGECYEVAVTNLAGLYRYRLGDIIKVVDYHHESPVIEFLYRRGQLINLVGEKTSEETVSNAVYGVMQEWGAKLVDFTTMVDYESYPCRYIFYVETAHPDRDQVGCGETLLEDTLYRTNLRYRSVRQTYRLGQLALRVVRPGTFEKLKKVLIARGASACHVKIPRVIRDRELASLLTANALYPASDARLAM